MYIWTFENISKLVWFFVGEAIFHFWENKKRCFLSAKLYEYIYFGIFGSPHLGFLGFSYFPLFGVTRWGHWFIYSMIRLDETLKPCAYTTKRLNEKRLRSGAHSTRDGARDGTRAATIRYAVWCGRIVYTSRLTVSSISIYLYIYVYMNFWEHINNRLFFWGIFFFLGK